MAYRGKIKIHPLHDFITEGNLREITSWFKRSPHTFSKLLKTRDLSDRTPFLLALHKDDWRIVKFILQCDGAVVNDSFSYGGGVIHVAIQLGFSADKIEDLISYGADVDLHHPTSHVTPIVQTIISCNARNFSNLEMRGAKLPLVVITTLSWVQSCLTAKCPFFKYGPCFILASQELSGCLLNKGFNEVDVYTLYYHECSHIYHLPHFLPLTHPFRPKKCQNRCMIKMRTGTYVRNVFTDRILKSLAIFEKAFLHDGCGQNHDESGIRNYLRNSCLEDTDIKFGFENSPDSTKSTKSDPLILKKLNFFEKLFSFIY